MTKFLKLEPLYREKDCKVAVCFQGYPQLKRRNACVWSRTDALNPILN